MWEKIDRSETDSCWPWTGTIDADGYGRVSINGVMRPARRVLWELENGYCDPNLDITHNPPQQRLCCRLDHLTEQPRFAQRKRGHP